MKNGFILRILNGENHGLIRGNHHHLQHVLCVWWDYKSAVYHELLKPGDTVNANRYRQQMINLNHALIEKRPEWAKS